ncbi:MAG: hypothetical protein ACP5M7_08690 [Thermoproteota archaeon]|jgi:hypothetical protein
MEIVNIGEIIERTTCDSTATTLSSKGSNKVPLTNPARRETDQLASQIKKVLEKL